MFWTDRGSYCGQCTLLQFVTDGVQGRDIQAGNNQQLLGQEYQHIKTSLGRCKYPDWVFHRLQTKMDYKLSLQHCNNNPNPHRDTNKDIFLVVPYSKGLNKHFKNICGEVGVQVHSKCSNTVKDLLVAPKDRDNIVNKGGVIYWYKCDHPGCTMEYIGKMGRRLGDRYKEHLRGPSPIFDHSQTTGHSIKLENFSTVDRESQGITRTIKEVIYI